MVSRVPVHVGETVTRRSIRAGLHQHRHARLRHRPPDARMDFNTHELFRRPCCHSYTTSRPPDRAPKFDPQPNLSVRQRLLRGIQLLLVEPPVYPVEARPLRRCSEDVPHHLKQFLLLGCPYAGKLLGSRHANIHDPLSTTARPALAVSPTLPTVNCRDSPASDRASTWCSDLDVSHDYDGAQGRDEVEDADVFDLVGVLAQGELCVGAGDGFADLGIDADGH